MRPVPALITKLQTAIKTKIQTQAQLQIRTGRHQAPFRLKKTHVRAGAAALAVAAVGGVAAIPLTNGLASAAPSASIRQPGLQARSAHSGSAHTGSAQPASAKASGNRKGAKRDAAGGGRASAASHSTRPANSSSDRPAPAKAHRKPAATKHSAPALRCTGTSGMLPQNYATIVGFLTTHGYTKLAAAGIAGNMYQESMGNPESVGTGGGGLIGWTPLPAGFVTGNVAADLHTQLEAVLIYNQQWAQYIPMLNAATTATQAADVYMTYFERPGIPAAYNREGAAAAVASACGF